MMRYLMLLTVVALVATLAIPVLASEAERSAQEVSASIDEFAASPPPVIEATTVAADAALCADDDLECAVRAQHMSSGQEAD